MRAEQLADIPLLVQRCVVICRDTVMTLVIAAVKQQEVLVVFIKVLKVGGCLSGQRGNRLYFNILYEMGVSKQFLKIYI